MQVTATNGSRQEYHQDFLYKDHGEEAAKEKAAKNHKHIRDLFPECTVVLDYVWGVERSKES